VIPFILDLIVLESLPLIKAEFEETDAVPFPSILVLQGDWASEQKQLKNRIVSVMYVFKIYKF
jgi:hypothetical protein